MSAWENASVTRESITSRNYCVFIYYLYIFYYLLRVQPKLPPPSPLFYVCVLYLILSRSVFILYHFSHAGRTVFCVYIPACDMGLLVLFSFYPIWALLWSGHLVCPTLACPTLAYPLLQGSDSLPCFSLYVSCKGRTVCPVLVCLSHAGVGQFVLF